MSIVAPLEADTRVLIDRNLENLGWKLTGEDKNVFFEQPKTEEECQKLEHKRPDYVLYSPENKPLIIIEAKRKGERIDKALDQGISYAEKLHAPLVFATDGVFCKSFHTFEHKTPLLNGNELDEFIRQSLAMKFLNGAEINTVSPKVQYDRKELIQIFDYANNLLRGDGLSAGLERFSEFSNILFLKLLSEKGVVNDAYSWDTIKKIPLKGRIDYINSTVFKALNEYYNDTMKIFTPLSMSDNGILDEIIKALDPLTLTDVDSDIKGDAFEYFLKNSTASGNDLGEYFTPRHIVKTMVRLVNPQIGEKVYDPFCGTGGFLIESFRHIYNNMARNERNIDELKTNTIFGNEITKTARIAKMNMILAGDGHSGIQKLDSLANPIKDKYDVVLANMPYSQKTRYGNLYDIPSKNGDSICVQHCMNAINATSENGRMALVVPEGFLFRKDLKKIREYLLERSELQSIISLPQGVFLPYTGVKTDIIYATKVNQKIPSSKKRKNYWYFEVKSDGYSLDNYRRKLDTPSDLQKFEEYRKLDDTEQDSMLEIGFDIIPFDKIKEKDFNFVGSRYRVKSILENNYSNVYLNEVTTLIRGISFNKEERKLNYDNTDIGIVTTKAAQESGIMNNYIQYIDKKFYREDKILQEGDVLISLANSLNLVGRVTYVNQSYNNLSFGTFMGCIRVDKNKILPKYLFYILKSKYAKNYFLTTARTTTNISNLTFEDLENFSFPLPPLEIQEKIVKELEKYQNIIDGAEKTINNYFPIININPSWKFRKLGEIFKTTSGGTPLTSHKEYYDKKEISWLCSGEVRAGEIEESEKYISKIGLENSSAKIVPANSVLVAMYGATAGQVGILKKEMAINQAICAILPTEGIIQKFLYYLLVQYGAYLKSLSIGGAQPNLSQVIIKDLNIPIPPIEEQKQIVVQLEEEQELISSNKKLIEIFTKKIQDRINKLFE